MLGPEWALPRTGPSHSWDRFLQLTWKGPLSKALGHLWWNVLSKVP